MSATKRTRVLLADRPGAGHAALAGLIAATPGVTLVGDLHDPAQLDAAMHAGEPDVLVVDDRLVQGLRWADRKRDARLIVVGVDDDPGYVARARRLGAEAWIPKELADSLLPLSLLSRAAGSASAPRTPAAGSGSAR